MKPILILVVFLQSILLTVLSVSYFSTYQKLEKITRLLAENNTRQNDSKIPKQACLTQPQRQEPANHSSDSHVLTTQLEQLEQLVRTTVAETLRRQNILSRETVLPSNQLSESPQKTEEYFALNEQVSNYVSVGNITPQEFLALSQQMLNIHPTQQQQLLMRLASELNKQ
jgi:hypothetical protein